MASILRPYALLALALGALSSPVANDLVSTDDPLSKVQLSGRTEGSSADDPLSSGHQLFARAACKDNLGRCFNPTGTKPTDIASRSSATAFCSSFLSIPVVTSTIATTTPHTLITVTATVTASTEVQTSTEESDVVATETAQTTVTTTIVGPAKRGYSTAAPPNCATGSPNSPAAYSSVCACVGVTPSTTYVTATAPVATDTALETLSVTTTTVTVETSTVTTGTTTEVETSVVTFTPSPPAPLCAAAPNPYYVDGKSFTTYCDQYYFGSGNIGRTTGVALFSDCIKLCADTDGCVYSYWVSPTSRYSDKLYCYTFSSFTVSRLHADAGVDTFALNA